MGLYVEFGVWTFKTFNFHDGCEDKKCLRYEWDLRSFVVDKLPEDGILVPKHVGFDT